DHDVADAGHLDQDLAGAPVEQPAPQRADHRATAAPEAATRRWRGAWARGQTARATAPAASTGRRGVVMPSRVWTMRSICSLPAPPKPATACLTWLGEYSTTSHPAATASAMASPAAWATGMAVRALTWNRTRSTATTAGPRSR